MNYAHQLNMEIKSLNIEIRGHKYNKGVESEIEEVFLDCGLRPDVQGMFMPAAGPEMIADIVVELAKDVTVSAMVLILERIYATIKSVIKNKLSSTCETGCSTIRQEDCDYIISVNNAAGMNATRVNYNDLLSQMMNFVKDEKAKGRGVASIETPCEVQVSPNGLVIRTIGVGNYSLWLVRYKDNSDCSNQIYDAVNGVLNPVKSNGSTKYFIDISDKYYRR